MSKPAKPLAALPELSNGPPPPLEVLVLTPRRALPGGPVVKLLPNGSAPERAPSAAVNVIELGPAPRARLRLALTVPASADPTAVALATATFVAGVVGFDRKLKLTTSAALTSATDGELKLAFDAAPLGADLAPRLNRLLARIDELATACAPIALTAATVEPC